jgi:hypothetical protein
MQIYEVFRTKNNEPIPVTGTAATVAGALTTGNAMRQDPKSLIDPHRYGRAKQAGYAASAARSAQDLIDKGYGKLPTGVTPPASQIISQVRNDPAAQQLINNWASQWNTVSGQQVTEQADPAAYRASFVAWADQVVERTTRLSGALKQIKKNADWADKFKKAEADVVSTADNPQDNQRAVQEYFTLAIAAARAAAQNQAPQAADRAVTSAGLNDPQANALARALGIDAAAIAKLNAYLRKNNERINPEGTGSPSLDALLRAAKLL